jgi:hypothetical protein
MNNSNQALSGWAKAVMQLVNLVFLVLDTTGVKRDSDILRILIVDLAGKELYHQLVRPLRHTGEPNTAYTGILQADLDQAQSLSEQWAAFEEIIRGKFVLSYGLDFVQERLTENAQANHLPPIYLVGDCLYELASHYTHRSQGVKLSAALSYVGHPMLIPANAMGRAQAQIALIKAIGDGQPRPVRTVPKIEVYNDLDDHPF